MNESHLVVIKCSVTESEIVVFFSERKFWNLFSITVDPLKKKKKKKRDLFQKNFTSPNESAYVHIIFKMCIKLKFIKKLCGCEACSNW